MPPVPREQTLEFVLSVYTVALACCRFTWRHSVVLNEFAAVVDVSRWWVNRGAGLRTDPERVLNAWAGRESSGCSAASSTPFLDDTQNLEFGLTARAVANTLAIQRSRKRQDVVVYSLSTCQFKLI